MATHEEYISMAYNKVLDNILEVEALCIKDERNKAKLNEYSGLARKIISLFIGIDSTKQINKLEAQNVDLKSGNLQKLGIFDLPGYVLIKRFNFIGMGAIHKKIFEKSYELYGKKHAKNKTTQLIARLLSYSLIGVAVSLILGVIVMGFGNTTSGLAILSIGTIIVLVLVYAMYDEVNNKVKKRRDEITRQFPNVVSKLALLVTSGMIMDRAWNETAYSQNEILYIEMQKTSEELKNLVNPELAYGAFIKRCNTKETAKLASAILQNFSKGNAEIGRLLKDMAKEAWFERRHGVKRDSEIVKSKLMIPTMLMFLTILIMLVVPIAMSFSSL